DEILKALRRGTLEFRCVPVLCGAALKNKGIQPLLDAVGSLLPAPIDLKPVEGTNPKTGATETRTDDPSAPFSALAFKSIADVNGDLTFVRVYSGTATQGDQIWNATKSKRERVGRIFRMHAANRTQLDSMVAGDIVALVGLKDTITGDTLTHPDQPIVLEKMQFPDPVISMSIEPSSRADRDKLSEALQKIARE